MNYLTERKYSFTSSALPKDTFAVIDFSGEEGLSRTYRFDIGLVTDNGEIDLDAVMAGTAKFVIHREGHHDVPFNGILAAFEQQHAVDGYVFYRAVLVPRLWWLSLTHHNQVFLNKTVQDIVAAVLKDGGLTSMDFQFRLQGTYAPQEYVCQYDESHLDFIERWLAREGIYYFFEQMAGGERIVFTDTIIAHKKSRFGSHLNYSPPSGLDALHAAESMQGFVCRQHLLPRRVLLKDYNYRKPSLEMIGTAEVDATGRGERFVYGEHFRTPEEGNRLARIRAQALLCRKREFIGESTAPFVSPGFSFELEDHYRNEFNQQYLTLEMTHSGSQTGYLVSGIQRGLSDRERTVAYRNQFTAIPASVQFRPEKAAVQSKITGTLNARIDAAGSGKYAELDEQGRYKVILPFDMSGRKDGKASTWLRMIQPYAGSDHGMHFPLHKDTEVMLTFIEGNPDRPVIAGAAPNPETPSPVTGADQTMAKITTSGGNKIHIEDREGSQRILHQTPTANTWMRMGAPNDPPAASEGTGENENALWNKKGHTSRAVHSESKGSSYEEGFAFSTSGSANAVVGANYKLEVGGIANTVIVGGENKMIVGEEGKIILGGEMKLHYPHHWEMNNAKFETGLEKIKTWGEENIVTPVSNSVTETVTRVVGAVLNYVGNTYTRVWANFESFSADASETDGVLTRTVGQQDEVIADGTRAVAEQTDAIGSANETLGDLNSAVGEANLIRASQTMAAGELVTSAASQTAVSGENQQISGVTELL